MIPTILMILMTFCMGLLVLFEVIFIYYYNIGFDTEATEREDSDDDGEDGDEGRDDAGRGEAAGRENGTEEWREKGGAAGGAAGAEGDEAGDDAGAFEAGGALVTLRVGGDIFALFVPEENDEADQDALEQGERKNVEPVGEGLVDAKDAKEGIAEDFHGAGKAGRSHEFELREPAGEEVNK